MEAYSSLPLRDSLAVVHCAEISSKRSESVPIGPKWSTDSSCALLATSWDGLHIAPASSNDSSERIMSEFNYLCVGVLAAGIVLALAPAASAAPKLADPDDAAIKAAIASCKAEAKEKKIRFPSSRAFLRDCVTETIRNNPPKR
jgi:hypothetical protein